MPPDATDVRSGWVWIGDTYGEYFRFSCDSSHVADLAKELKLAADRASGTSTLWGRSSGGTTPNDPDSWVPASEGMTVYHKEDYFEGTNRSVMTLHYHEDLGAAFLNVDLWD